MKYTIIQEEPVQVISRENQDGTITSFTADPANSDYQAYINKDKEVANEL
jgi:hypothetical protein